MQQSKVFLIPGLGADNRAFQKLTGIEGYETICMEWIAHKKREPIEQYCERLIEKYNVSSTDKLIGLSFGGLIAQRIAEMLGTPEVILISSFRDKQDLKPLFRFGLKWKLYKLMPPIKIMFISRIVVKYLNSGSKESVPALMGMLQSSNMALTKWSIQKIDEAKYDKSQSTVLYPFIGDQDKFVKLWKHANVVIVPGGSHFMVYEEAEHLSVEINKIFSARP